MNDIWNFMDIIILGLGVYGLYSAYMLQNKGEIIKLFLVFKDTDVRACKDLPGYAALMAPKLYTLSTIMVVYGIISLINTYLVNVAGLYTLFVILFIGSLLWYGMAVSRALKIYFTS